MSINCKAIAITFAGLCFVLLGGCKDHSEKDEAQRQSQENKQTARVSWENGQAILTLDSATQSHLGLEIATLVATATRAQVTAPAVVLSGQDLAVFRSSYFATRAQLEKSRIEAGVASKEYARLKTLFDENQNISEKSLQSAEGTLQTSEADVQSGEKQLSLQESVVRQEWGSLVTGWAVNDSPELHRVFNQEDVLVQMTGSSNVAFVPPKSITLQLPGGGRTEAHFVSPLPRVDPRIQGQTFLYLASTKPGLAPGMNLLARLAIGAPMTGVVVPSAAVIWSEGIAWVYQQTGVDRFARAAVTTDIPVDQGFLLTHGFPPGTKIVVRGAQALLSEEVLLHGQAGGEVDVD